MADSSDDLDAPQGTPALGRAPTETASQARLDLLAIVSHDLRNPLGSILTGAALLDKLEVPPPTGDRLRKYTGIVRRAAERMNRWISALLDLAVIDSGELTLERGPVEAASLIRTAAEEHAPTAAEKGIRLACAIRTDPGTVHVDRARIIQVLSNLIGNALKFTPPGGEVLVAADELDGTPTFSVRDNGPGIAAEQLPKIFERYWQARSQRGVGTGLGLAIARGLIEAHGGALEVESVPGAGATFTFRVPR